MPDDATLVKLLDFNDLLTVAAKFLTSPAEKEKHVANIPHAGGGNLTRLVQEAMMLLVAPLAQRRTLARTVVLSPESVGQPQSTPLLSVVPELDRWLMTHDDMPDSAALQKELDVLGAGIRARSSADPGTSALEAIVLDPEFWEITSVSSECSRRRSWTTIPFAHRLTFARASCDSCSSRL